MQGLLTPDIALRIQPMTEQELLRRILGSLITTLRERAGLSQHALAKKIGVAQSTVSRFERGETPIEWIALRDFVVAVNLPELESLQDLLLMLEARVQRLQKLRQTFQGTPEGTPLHADLSEKNLRALLAAESLTGTTAS